MKRFAQTELMGNGVEPLEGQWTSDRRLAVTQGSLIHKIAELKWQQLEWEEWLKQECRKLFAPEIWEMRFALLRRAFKGWLHVRWPFFQSNYQLMSAEKEWTWQMDSLVEMPIRMDKIVRNLDTGLLGVVDFKTMNSVDINWIYRMKNDDQTHLYLQALKEKSGELTSGICYEGLILGKWEDGRQKSPLVRGYKTKSGKVQVKWLNGAEEVSLLDYSDDAWMEWMLKQDALKDLYPTTGFLLPNSQQLINTKQSTVVNELKWFDQMEQIRQVEKEYGFDSLECQNLINSIEKNRDNCLKYGWGHACEMYQWCWENGSLDSFGPRTDHHQIEED